jgi:hypothetical protein
MSFFLLNKNNIYFLTQKGKIQTLLHEPRFKIFYEIPVYELSRYEKQLRESITQEGVIINENVRPWPEVQYLFGEDEDYQDVISQIMTHLTTSLNNISTYIQVIEMAFSFK